MLNYNRKNSLGIKSMRNDMFTILVSELAYKQMEFIVKNSSEEVGWLLIVDKCEGNKFDVRECIILDQEVNGVTCELSPEALNSLALELLTNGQEDLYDRIGGWCHSHVNMPVIPSSQDNEQMKYFKDGNDWFIRGIANKKGELKFDIFDYKTGLIFEDVKWELARPKEIADRIRQLQEELNMLCNMEDADLENEIIEELKEKVKKKEVKYVPYGGGLVNYSNATTISNYKSPKTKEYFSIFDFYDYYELLEMYCEGTYKLTRKLEKSPFKFSKEEIEHAIEELELEFESSDTYFNNF